MVKGVCLGLVFGGVELRGQNIKSNKGEFVKMRVIFCEIGFNRLLRILEIVLICCQESFWKFGKSDGYIK